MFYHVTDLAENVDETPEFEIKEDNTTVLSNRSRKARMADNTTETDITNPANNEKYAEYISSDRYFWGVEHTNIKNANVYIDYVKSVKDELISCVTMLNTWVEDVNCNCRYRISYNQANDVVYLEKISDGSLYIRISSTYVNGKMVIDAYQYQIYDANGGVEISCHYEEDKVLYYYESSNFTYRNLFMLTADLSVENPVNVCLSYASMDQGDRIGYQMSKYLYKMGTEDESALDVHNTYFIDDLIKEFNNFSDTVIINNSNDEYVLSAQNDVHTYSFALDMYELEGYTQIIRGDSQYKIIVGENTFACANSDSHGAENSIVYETEDFCAMAYVYEYGTVRLCVGVEVRNEQLTQSRALTEFLGYMGLSFKDESVYGKLDLLDNASELLNQYTYFDYSYPCYVSPEEMEQIYSINKWTSVSYEEIMDMLVADSVDIHEQVEDEEYYALYAGAVSGKVGCNEDNTFNLSQVCITLGDSGILTSGSEYALVAYISNGYETYLLDRAAVTFAGVPVTISLNDNVAIPNDLTIGKYRVVAYLTTLIEGADVRVSSIYTLEGEGEFDAITTITEDDASYFVRVVSNDDGLVVAMDNMFELKGQAEYVEETKYLSLGGISGTLSNGYIMLESDLVSLTATFYDDADKEVMAIKDEFYFGTSALSASVSLEEIPALQQGTYQLEIAYKVTNKDGEIIFSAIHNQTEEILAAIVEEQRTDVDLVSLDVYEGKILFKYVKVVNVDLVVTYENDIIDTSNSELHVMEPIFFEDTDVLHLDINFINEDENKASICFSTYATYSLIEDEFVFPTEDLNNYSIEGGKYKLEYRLIITNYNGENKLDKIYYTNQIFDIVSTETENIE
ncbi:MAG: hypothetical protein IJ033_02535 [Clostridia bacterium]|nr:hypothetical protein [Clostridia bacterium]